MKLYLISQNDNVGYDTFRAAVVAAKSADDARSIHPDGSGRNLVDDSEATWTTDPARVTVCEVGTAAKGVERGVVCSDFSGERDLV